MAHDKEKNIKILNEKISKETTLIENFQKYGISELKINELQAKLNKHLDDLDKESKK
jgi:hypothetical protein